MIINEHPDVVTVEHKIQAMMRASSVTFYLTGSHFFKTATCNSDWDYMAEKSEFVKVELQCLGFTKNFKASYEGDVYKHAEANIHVILKHDVLYWVKAQEIIAAEKWGYSNKKLLADRFTFIVKILKHVKGGISAL